MFTERVYIWVVGVAPDPDTFLGGQPSMLSTNKKMPAALSGLRRKKGFFTHQQDHQVAGIISLLYLIRPRFSVFCSPKRRFSQMAEISA